MTTSIIYTFESEGKLMAECRCAKCNRRSNCGGLTLSDNGEGHNATTRYFRKL